MPLRSALILFALTVAAAVTALPAQQAPDSLPAQSVVRAREDSTPSAISPASLPAPGPRLSPQFQNVRPHLAPSNGFERSSRMAAAGQTTITISTLTLVLIVIIVVLLVT